MPQTCRMQNVDDDYDYDDDGAEHTLEQWRLKHMQ